MATNTQPLSVVKYDPTTTTVLETSADISEGAPIYINSSRQWAAAAAASSTCATHIALTDMRSTATTTQPTKYFTGFTRGQVQISTACTNYGGLMWLSATAGEYVNSIQSTAQVLGTLVNYSGDIVEINIDPVNNIQV